MNALNGDSGHSRQVAERCAGHAGDVSEQAEPAHRQSERREGGAELGLDPVRQREQHDGGAGLRRTWTGVLDCHLPSLPHHPDRLRLRKPYFDLIASGVKTVEVRVGYADMRKIRPGQSLMFVCGDEKLPTEVKQVTEYASFEEMLDHEDPHAVGPPRRVPRRVPDRDPKHLPTRKGTPGRPDHPGPTGLVNRPRFSGDSSGDLQGSAPLPDCL
ncbi:ASCH domain-containing protein [Streptosporangium sp. NPDC006013]|uniref:ASCH domain-containing protein n=1 Tax=Streptosporangium sp. NPDC006013 TaxID=3155596 RepID=UPI0033A301CC